MPKSRLGQRLRNKLNRTKEAEVPQISFQHIRPFFLLRNRQPFAARKKLQRRSLRRDVAYSERERAEQKAK